MRLQRAPRQLQSSPLFCPQRQIVLVVYRVHSSCGLLPMFAALRLAMLLSGATSALGKCTTLGTLFAHPP